MKKRTIIFTIFLFIMTVNISYGQFGIRAGANLASFKIKVDVFGLPVSQSTDDKIGGHLGVFYKSEISEKFFVRPNFLFTTGGAKFDDDLTGESSSLSATYLGLPIDFMYNIPVGEKSLSLVGGPFLGYLLSSSSSDGGDEEELSTLDYGLNFGLQLNLKKIGIGLSYGIGLANIIPEEQTNSLFFEDASANSRIVSLYFTYDL